MDIIIGAGVTGLTVAKFTDNDYKIFDGNDGIGGYCRTIKQDGFIWDYSGHFFHFQNENVRRWLLDSFSDEDLLKVNKITEIYKDGYYIDFPFQKNIHQLPKDKFINCLVDLYNNDPDKPSESFKEFVVNLYGQSICDEFLIPYNQKLYATDLNLLDKDAMGRFFPKATFGQIVDNFKKSDSDSYNSYFIYPKGGAIEYVNSIAKDVDSSKISLSNNIVSIDTDLKVVVDSNGKEYEYDRLISTMPFNKLLDLIGYEYDKSIYTYNKVSVFNLGFDLPSIRKSHWIYVPDEVLSFYRVGFYNNIMGTDRASMYVEVGHSSDEIVDKDILLERVLKDLKSAGFIDHHQLISYKYIIMDPAYVHVNTKCESDKKIIKTNLANKGIYSLGRYGDWKYCSIEDNIIEAITFCEKTDFLGA